MRRLPALACGVLASLCGAFACGGSGSPTRPGTPGAVAVLVGAGDIADCNLPGAAQTAALLDSIQGMVFTTGDNAYPSGSPDDFARCYEPTWGRHLWRTRPSPGNHDYLTAGASAYFAYFGQNAGAGYYSYTVGSWHVVSLDSNIAAAAGSEQEQWLRNDLAAARGACTLAYWHHPVFSSGPHGNVARMTDILRTLYEFGTSVVLNGHEHTYERFAPQDPDGRPDPSRGIREFVVGTGGARLYSFGAAQPNSEVRYSGSFGVLKLTLRESAYDWEFVPVAGGTFHDAGSGACVR